MDDSGKDSNDPNIGRVLDGRYELTHFLAAGGMGRIYRATQQPLQRAVAIKLLNSAGAASEEFRGRFFLEASLCARLTHPHIVRIFDFGCDRGDTYYIAMEFLQGQTLSDRLLEQGPLPTLQALHIIQQACAGLVDAHHQGMVHRDLKSSNIMLCSHAGEADFVKIVDFGIVKDTAASDEVTMAGAMLGSPIFMSPEQINGADVDGRSDIYSLGIMLYQMLMGRPPFQHTAAITILIDHLNNPPPAFAFMNPDIKVPACVEALVKTCLEKKREQRYASATDLHGALSDCVREISAFPVSVSSGRMVSYDPENAEATKSSGSAGPPQHATAMSPTRVEQDLRTWQAHSPYSDTTPYSVGTTNLMRLKATPLRGYVGFVDFNCPFCFALHERMTAWGLVDCLQWNMVEHDSHVNVDHADLHAEQILSEEVFAVHHRAPDIELRLPPRRCRSTMANRLTVHVQRQFPARLSSFRGQIYRALWQDGQDIGDPAVLEDILSTTELPTSLLDLCHEAPPEIEAWQNDWKRADFDCCIPALSHAESGRVLLGLPTQTTLAEFLLEERSRIVDSAVCYYQRQPVILICGWMSHLWPILSDVRGSCELLQAPSAQHALDMLGGQAVPDLLLIEAEHIEAEELQDLISLARSRSIHWALAARHPTAELELQALSFGAAEYLPIGTDPTIARTRLKRVMADRFSADRLRRNQAVDSLTGLTSRREFIVHLEDEWGRALRSGARLSFILMDLDHFQAFNDRHGYLAGNQVLARIGKLLRAALHRPGDRLARFGGNEFAVLLPASDEATARQLAATLQESVSGAQIEHGGGEAGPFMTISVGAASLQAAADGSIHKLHDEAVMDLRQTRGRG